MPETASVFEIGYSSVFAIGLGLAIVNALWHLARYRALKASGENGILELQRRGALYDQLRMVGVFMCLTAFGINAMFSPRNPTVPTTAGQVTGAVFLFMGALLLWQTVATRLRARQQRREIEQGDGK